MDLYAQAAPTGQTGFAFGPLIMFGLIFVIFYFIIIMPAKKKQKQHAAMIDGLKGGERVITAGGIYGTISRVLNDRFEILVDKDTKIQVAKSSVNAVLTNDDAAAQKE
jgi:preprotein translocase subunit YajC